MNKGDVQAYFDRYAAQWDERLQRPKAILEKILDAAGVRLDSVVLDVACGTGVLFEDYLARGAECVTGVDLSPEMVRIARRKFPQSHIEVLCADVETITLPQKYDCCLVYNALPHFVQPLLLIRCLARFVATGGRLCIAHSMSREALIRHHEGRADTVSQLIPEAHELAALFAPWFTVETAISDTEKYIVAGVRREYPACASQTYPSAHTTAQ